MAARGRRRSGVDDVVLMPVSPARQRRQRFLALVVALVVAVGCLLAGLWIGGGGMLDSNQLNSELRVKLNEAREELSQARHDLALYRAESEVGDQAREQLRQEIRGLRDQTAELEEAVSFYKNVMSPGASDEALQVQKFEIAPAEGERRFRYRLILVQSGDNRGYLSGDLELALIGVRDGERVTVEGDEVLDENSDLRFRFRYFQELSGIVTVPEDFDVESLEMEARSTGGRRSRVAQSLPW